MKRPAFKVLGVNIYHDRAACVVEDGRVLVAIAEERLDHIKHSKDPNNLPFKSIEYCSEVTGYKITDYDAIVVTCPKKNIEVLSEWIDQLKSIGLKDSNKVHTLSHHLAHAYSTYFPTNFKEALIWVADGGGSMVNGLQEGESAYIAKGYEISPIWQRFQVLQDHNAKHYKNLPISLGRKYEQLTHRLGFGFGEAGRVMALASYGNYKRFKNHPLGDVKANSINLNYTSMLSLINKFKKTDPIPDFYNSSTKFDGWWADISAQFQSFLEKAQLKIIGNLMKKYKQNTLCISGGVALNCVANSLIIERLKVKKWYIQPAASDEGQALGAAYYGYYKVLKGRKRHQQNNAYLGKTYSKKEIINTLNKYPQLTYKEVRNLEKLTASELSKNKIIGWVQGGSEYGPRALGHRSILANPTNPAMKKIINSRIKKRESFRPFAPSITTEDISNFFEFKGKSPYMQLAIKVKNKYRKLLPPILHIDNTSRLQTVDRSGEPRFHKLLKEFAKLTGYPILLNTSFNINGQPIVETPKDAIECFIKEDIDLLVIGNFLICKNK